MASDATFANSMSELGISIPRSSTGSILGKSPANWVWHHDVGVGVMQLVPKAQHTTGSMFWNTMHPGGLGGMSIWGKGENKKQIKDMKLVELIKYLIDSEQLNELYQKQRLNTESEALLIYLQDDLSLESEITIFEIEETEDDLVFEKGGIQYVQLFPLDYAVELIESDLDLKDKEYSDLEIAKRLLEYRQKDA